MRFSGLIENDNWGRRRRRYFILAMFHAM